jgi:hypothetical protein
MKPNEAKKNIFHDTKCQKRSRPRSRRPIVFGFLHPSLSAVAFPSSALSADLSADLSAEVSTKAEASVKEEAKAEAFLNHAPPPSSFSLFQCPL